MKPSLFSILLCTLFLGCFFSSCEKVVKDDDEEPQFVSDKNALVYMPREVNLLFRPLVNNTRYSYMNERYDTWKTNKQLGSYTAWVKQDGLFVDSSNCEARYNADSSQVEFFYNRAGLIDTEKKHEVYVTSASFAVHDNEIFYRKSLQRDNASLSYAYGAAGPGYNGDIKKTVGGVLECAVVVNLTETPVTFIHKGFEAEHKWYYQSAEISCEDGHVTQGNEVKQDVFSPKQTLPVRSEYMSRYITSTYAPTGYKIKDAVLVAEIDGKEVRTSNKLSSDVDLEVGKLYYYVLEWDGHELRFVLD